MLPEERPCRFGLAIPLALLGLAFLASSASTRADDPNPTTAAGLNERGNAWYAKSEYDKAIADYTEAIRLDPTATASVAFRNRGNAWRCKKEYDKAIKDYTEAIRLDPGNARSFSFRGDVQADRREWEKAIADFTEAIRLDPMSSRSGGGSRGAG